MMDSALRRSGVSLLELLVVIAIIAILLALIVVGVMQTREAALRAESENHLRQIILAVHHFADAHEQRLPTLGGNVALPLEPVLLVAILPYVEQAGVFLAGGNDFPPIPLYISPADPTAQIAVAQGKGVSSYAANGQVFRNQPRMSVTFRDGLSNTIAFAEHYAGDCGNYTFYYFYSFNYYPAHAPSFADDGDDFPVTSGPPPTSTSYVPGLTFQVVPSTCVPIIAQTPHRSGMLVAMGDGSVRTLATGMSETTYWAAVTPAGGEVLGSDW